MTAKKLVSGVTEIEPWFFETFNKNCPNVELFIKRDDNTGAALTGNKVRKLEFLLADALEKGCDSIITCGMATSNHCRTTALACARLGLDCHLVSPLSLSYHPTYITMRHSRLRYFTMPANTQ